MASCGGMDVYIALISKLHGKEQADVSEKDLMSLISCKLFSRCEGTVDKRGVKSLESNQASFFVGPLMLDTIDLIFNSGVFLCVLIK